METKVNHIFVRFSFVVYHLLLLTFNVFYLLIQRFIYESISLITDYLNSLLIVQLIYWSFIQLTDFWIFYVTDHFISFTDQLNPCLIKRKQIGVSYGWPRPYVTSKNHFLWVFLDKVFHEIQCMIYSIIEPWDIIVASWEWRPEGAPMTNEERIWLPQMRRVFAERSLHIM
jgi:hypothetical protein